MDGNEVGSLTRTLSAGDIIRLGDNVEFWVRRGKRCKVTITAPKVIPIDRDHRSPGDQTPPVERITRKAAGVLLFLAGLSAGALGSQGHQQRMHGLFGIGERVAIDVPRPSIAVTRIEQELETGGSQTSVGGVVDRDREPRSVGQVEVRLHRFVRQRHVKASGSVGDVNRFKDPSQGFVAMCSHGADGFQWQQRDERQHQLYRPMALRIYGTPADGADDPKRQTLRAAYARHLAPSQVDRRANKTTQGYRTALGHWEAFVASQSGESTGQTDARGSITNTPAPESVPFCRPVDQIGAITDDMLNAWGVWLMASDGAQLSLGTAAKQWRHIRAILRRVGPRESGNPRGAGILDAVPAMDPLAELAVIDELGVLTDGAEDITDDQIDAIYDACDVATWPAGSPALQWKTYLVILSVMGPRVNDAATLTAANFSFDPTSPIRRSVRTYPHGWLIYLPTKTKSKKPARLIVPLPPCVAAHVSALESRRRGELFGWNDARGHAFARQWQRIVATAGLPHVERRHFRSTANIRWDRAGGDRQLGRWVLGHASRDVNDQHYMRAEPDLIEAAPLVEVPSRFNGGNPGDAPSQLFLFS